MRSQHNDRQHGLFGLFGLFVLVLLLLVPSAAVAGDRESGAGFAGVVDPAIDFFAGPGFQQLLAAPAKDLDDGLDVVHRLSHDVPIGEGRTLRVYEYFSLRNWLQHPRRGVVFLSGSVFNGLHWSLPHPDYDAAAMAAEHGFFSYTVDFLGVGASFKPASGFDVEFEDNVAAVETVVRYVRFFRHVPKLDLVGEGYGGAVATQVARDPGRIRSTVSSSSLYKHLLGGPLTDPEFVSMLQEAENGYFFLPPFMAIFFSTSAPPEVVDYVAKTQTGFYPSENMLVALPEDLPFFDPGVAKVPGLILWGPGDVVADRADAEAHAADYGRAGATLVVLDGAGHAPRTESPEIARRYWDEVWSFLLPWPKPR